MPSDSIPKKKQAVKTFLTNFTTVVATDPAKWGHVPADVTRLQGDVTLLNNADAAHDAAALAYHTAVSNRETAYESVETDVRGSVRRVMGMTDLTPADLASVDLQPHSTNHTRSPVPTSHPVGRIVLAPHLGLTLHISDVSTPTKAKKPAGVSSCEIWRFIGATAPADWTGYTYLRRVTESKFVDTFTAAQGGSGVFYMLRWQNGTGEPGPWSDPVPGKVLP